MEQDDKTPVVQSQQGKNERNGAEMRKILSFLLIAALSAFLCACGGENAKSDRRYMVSALGFGTDGALINVFAEIIIVNSEDPESSPETKVFSAAEPSISAALDKIGSSLEKPMLLNHCAVIAVGEKMTPYWFGKICDYCFNENRITMSAYMVSVKDPYELLSGKSRSSAAKGYDIMEMIEQQSERTGLSYNSRYFEIEAARESGKKTFTLPHFVCDESGASVDGLSVFCKDRLITNLNNEDSGCYAVITGGFEKGTLRFGAEEYRLRSRKVDYLYSDGKENKIVLRLKLSGDDFDGDACNRLEKSLEELYDRIKNETGNDAFGFYDILSFKYSEFEDKYKSNYNEFFGSADFVAKCES